MLPEQIQDELNSLPLASQKEVLDFILFLKNKIKENDTDYLSQNPKIKEKIIDGLNTPLDECSKDLNW